MNILVVGDKPSHIEFNAKFKGIKSTNFRAGHELKVQDILEAQVVFDFRVLEDAQHSGFYLENPKATLFLNTVKSTLLEQFNKYGWTNPLIGFNGLPGMFNRSHLEITGLNESHLSKGAEVCEALGTKFLSVDDRVGMVTPRVVCMIINEAFYTVQEGTATEEDINLAMKLGTNYPSGPFEFCEAIGITNVYELLDALYQDTKEERYKICPLLKKRYLNNR